MTNISNSINYSNSYLYNNSSIDDKTKLNNTTAAQENENNANLSDNNIKEIIENLLENKDELSLHVSYSYFQNNMQSLENTRESRYQSYASYNKTLPTDGQYSTSLDYLMQEAESILINAYKEQPNGEKFRNLLGSFRNLKDNIQDFNDYKEKLLNLLKQGQQNAEFAKSKEFNDKLFNTIHTIDNKNTLTLQEVDMVFAHNQENGFLDAYRVNSGSIADNLEMFFSMANDFGLISSNKETDINKSLQTSLEYLGSQSGDIGNSLTVGGFTISWDGNTTLHNAILSGFTISIFSNQFSNESLASLSSNFDSTQSFFDILEKRDKLEKENQELKAKQAYSAYGISTNSIQTDSKSDSLMQTLLKDSKESKNAKTSKTF